MAYSEDERRAPTPPPSKKERALRVARHIHNKVAGDLPSLRDVLRESTDGSLTEKEERRLRCALEALTQFTEYVGEL